MQQRTVGIDLAISAMQAARRYMAVDTLARVINRKQTQLLEGEAA